MGVHAGVQQQLRDKLSPIIVGVHCTCHKTAPVMNDAGSHEILSLVDSLISGVHSLFYRSYKRQQEWEAFAKARGVKRIMFPLYVKTCRLSRTDCLDVLCINFPILLAFWGQYNAKPQKDSQYWPSAVHLRERLMGLRALST